MRSIQKRFLFVIRADRISLVEFRTLRCIFTLPPLQTCQSNKEPKQSFDLFVAVEEPYEAEVSCTVLE